MIQETVTIPTKGGYPLVGVLRIPEYTGTFPAVIICHGFLENKDRELLLDITNGISYARMITLRFDFSNHGESGGQPHHVTLSQQAKDIKAVIDFLETIQEVDKERIVIVGHDLGAMAAVVARDPRVKAYVTINMRSDTNGFVNSYFSDAEIREWKETKMYDCQEIHRLHVEFLHDLYKQDILDILSKIVRPFLIIQGTNDKRTPYENARALAYHAKFPAVEMVDGADHNFSDKKQRQYIIDVMTDWLRKTIQ